MDNKVSSDEEYPEIDDLLKEQEKRHKQVVLTLFLVGLVLSISGLMIWNTDQQWHIVGALLMAIGLFMKARALLSWFTNIDRQQ